MEYRRGIILVTPTPTIDPATAMCCGGAICITVLLVASIVAILASCGISTWLALWFFKMLGQKSGKK
ncbi:hypothetical protein [Methanocella sp. MCL-LM]|uniref:hypothetical protein n=1 Tax=Methanocella sp. MCL-LM TaxID=3412035 RepID=UPI003C73B9B1